MNLWEGVDAEQAEGQLRGLTRRLAELDVTMQATSRLAAERPDSFAARLSLTGLEQLHSRLQAERSELVKHRIYEKVVLKFDGPEFANHTASLGQMGFLLIHIQKLYSAIAQAITTGPRLRGPISNEIMRATNLRLADVFPSSFGIEVYVKTNYDEMGESTAVASLTTMFSLLNSTQNQPNISRLSAELGQRSVTHLRRVLNNLDASHAGFAVKWQDSSGISYDWNAPIETMPVLTSNVKSFKEERTEEKIIEGALAGASLIRDRFELITRDGAVLEGKVTRAVKPKLLSLFGRPCVATIDQVDIVETLIGETKTYYTMTDIRPAEPQTITALVP